MPRFMAAALGMGAAWTMKMTKKSIFLSFVVVFFSFPFAQLSWGQGDREGRVGWGSGDGERNQGSASQETVCCSPLGRQEWPGWAMGCQLVEALSMSRACDQSWPDAWRMALIS